MRETKREIIRDLIRSVPPDADRRSLARVSITGVGAALMAFALGACGFVDNSGGEPPAGDAVTFRFLEATGELGGVDEADLITASNVASATVCQRAFGDDAAHPFCTDQLDALDADETLVVVMLQLGGCLSPGVGVTGVYLDAAQVNVHYLRADSSYGRMDAACTDDLGAYAVALAVKGVDDATDADLLVGTYNPDLPGAPENTASPDAR